MRVVFLGLVVGAMSMVAACASEAPVEEPTAQSTASFGSEDDPDEASPHAPVALVDQGTSTLLPFVEPMRRARQRMTIDQVSATLTRVTGGLGWTEIQGGREVDLFDVFGSSLGVPDYVEVTREDLSASALFHKFLDEAARQVCSELVDQETGSEPVEMHLMVHADADDTLESAPEAIDANLRYLLLRYHGRKVGEDGVALNAWRWLFHSVTHVSGEPAIGWRAVCVGLISHPEFYSY